MNYREKMREAIRCPQFGDIDYGEWGALRLDQRILIKRLLDEMDGADEYIKKLYFDNEKLFQIKQIINNDKITGIEARLMIQDLLEKEEE